MPGLLRLYEDETLFADLYDSANEGVWLVDAQDRVARANTRMAALLGLKVADIIGRPRRDFAFEEDAAYLAELHSERVRGYPAVLDLRLRHRDGSAVWALMSARAIFREGRYVGALDFFTDITARRTAEEKFRVFFELSAAGHALVDPQSKRFLHVNERWCQMLGRTREELVGGLTFVDITHPEDRQLDEQRFADLRAGRIAEVVADKRYLRKDGSVFWGHLTSSVVRNRQGVPELQLSVVQDITTRKQAEADVIDSRTRLRLALEATDLGLFFHDGLSGRDVWNEHARRLLGLGDSDPEAISTFMSRVHPEDRTRVEARFSELMRVAEFEQEFQLEFRVVWGDGSEHYLAAHGVSQPRATAEGGATFHLIGTLRDITDTRRFENELRAKVASRTHELEETTRQLESFCYTIAHDLRAPLRAIKGYADLLADDVPAGRLVEAQSHIERVRFSVQRLDALIRDLLAYSRVSQLDLTLEPVDLGLVVSATLNDLDSEIRRTQATVRVPTDLPAVVGERAIVEQIAANLLSNAIKFSRPGTAAVVDVSATRHDGQVRLAVRDHGIGIAPEFHTKIFDVFQRLHTGHQYPGTGIGLAIVARGAERIGARCGVESAPGQGSTFWVEFRAAE